MRLSSGELQPPVFLHALGRGVCCAARGHLCFVVHVSSLLGLYRPTIYKRTCHRRGLHAVACGGSPRERAMNFKEEGGMALLRKKKKKQLRWDSRAELGAGSRVMGVLQ